MEIFDGRKANAKDGGRPEAMPTRMDEEADSISGFRIGKFFREALIRRRRGCLDWELNR
jgi:hypothetical protein